MGKRRRWKKNQVKVWRLERFLSVVCRSRGGSMRECQQATWWLTGEWCQLAIVYIVSDGRLGGVSRQQGTWWMTVRWCQPSVGHVVDDGQVAFVVSRSCGGWRSGGVSRQHMWWMTVTWCQLSDGYTLNTFWSYLKDFISGTEGDKKYYILETHTHTYSKHIQTNTRCKYTVNCKNIQSLSTHTH